MFGSELLWRKDAETRRHHLGLLERKEANPDVVSMHQTLEGRDVQAVHEDADSSGGPSCSTALWWWSCS